MDNPISTTLDHRDHSVKPLDANPGFQPRARRALRRRHPPASSRSGTHRCCAAIAPRRLSVIDPRCLPSGYALAAAHAVARAHQAALTTTGQRDDGLTHRGCAPGPCGSWLAGRARAVALCRPSGLARWGPDLATVFVVYDGFRRKVGRQLEYHQRSGAASESESKSESGRGDRAPRPPLRRPTPGREEAPPERGRIKWARGTCQAVGGLLPPGANTSGSLRVVGPPRFAGCYGREVGQAGCVRGTTGARDDDIERPLPERPPGSPRGDHCAEQRAAESSGR